MEIESRQFQITEKNGTLCGYASVYSVPYDCGDFLEIIAPGAFKRELERTDLDVAAQIEHKGGLDVIGRTTNGTLQLSSDKTGLYYCVSKLPDTQTGRDILTLVRDGYIRKSSIQYSVVSQTWDFTGSKPTRTITDCKLYDVAPVSIPASPSTSCYVRAKEEYEQAKQVPAVVETPADDISARLKKKIDAMKEKPRLYK